MRRPSVEKRASAGNVYPQEVESCLREHPAVAESAIAVVADAEFGARMRAFIVVREDARLMPDELRSWLRQRLDRHKQPRSIELVDALPRNALGKIDRPALQQLPEPRVTSFRRPEEGCPRRRLGSTGSQPLRTLRFIRPGPHPQ